MPPFDQHNRSYDRTFFRSIFLLKISMSGSCVPSAKRNVLWVLLCPLILVPFWPTVLPEGTSNVKNFVHIRYTTNFAVSICAQTDDIFHWNWKGSRQGYLTFSDCVCSFTPQTQVIAGHEKQAPDWCIFGQIGSFFSLFSIFFIQLNRCTFSTFRPEIGTVSRW